VQRALATEQPLNLVWLKAAVSQRKVERDMVSAHALFTRLREFVALSLSGISSVSDKPPSLCVKPCMTTWLERRYALRPLLSK
jgi:hypothetical protein